MPSHLFASTSLAFALFAIASPRAEAQTNDVGVNAHDAEPAVLDMAADLGVGWIRVDANWFQMEPRRGELRWILDDAVRGATDRGVKVYVTLAYTADWVPRVERRRSDGYGGNDEPLGSDEWRAFVTEAVRHHRALGVTHFGIWNEPNLDHFFEGSVDAYIDKILIPGADAVHDACSDCVVLGPDLAHVGDYHDYLGPILRRAGDRIDVVAHHIYQSFPELGVTLFDGDNFVQALEMRRFSFTRPSLREVLDAEGWRGEVWITETGHRASRIGDPADEGDQATFVRLVLEEQLARDWWTNTFFYEAVDCGVDIEGCDIDGFGLTRPARSRPRAFPGDFRTKPAYDELRSFIASHPSIGAGGADPMPDPSGAPTVDVPKRAMLSVDGTLDDFAGVSALRIDRWDGERPRGDADDLAATLRVAWDEETLVVALDVTDDVHVSGSSGRLWEGDSVQLAVDVRGDGGTGYGDDDHELTVALVDGAGAVRREAGVGALPRVAVVRSGVRTIYEIALDATVLPGVDLRPGSRVHASLLINDADGEGREGWLELTPGIGREKAPEHFAFLRLLDGAAPPDPSADDAGTIDDAGIPVDDGAAPSDGSSTPPPAPPGTAGSGGCAAQGSLGSSAGAWAFLVATLLVARRRRRI